MRISSRSAKLSGFAGIFVLFVIGSLHSAGIEAHVASQATTSPCPTLDTVAMMPTAESTMSAASSAPSNMTQPGFLNLELGAADNCGVQVLQIFSGSAAASVLQVNDVIVAVDCVPLADMVTGSMATASASDSTMSNCMNPGTMNANGSMTGVIGAMSNPACMNTGVAGGTLRVTSLFFCIIAQYHAGDTVTLTLWRNNQQMNVQVTLDAAPAATLFATESGPTAASGAASSGSSATSAATSPAVTTPEATLTETPVSTATSPATP